MARDKLIQIRVTQEEFRLIQSGYSCNLSKYIRDFLLNDINERLTQDQYEKIVEEEEFKRLLEDKKKIKDEEDFINALEQWKKDGKPYF